MGLQFIRNFMLIIGPVSSVFDILIFYIMLAVFHAGETLFHTGWFIESMATQVLAIFIIRTRKSPFRSRPNPWLIATIPLITHGYGARQEVRSATPRILTRVRRAESLFCERPLGEL